MSTQDQRGGDNADADCAEANYRAALDWRAKGYNVVPQKVGGVKHPAVRWKELQTKRVTEDDLHRWRPKFANGVGFITGDISGVTVIESDGAEGEAVLAEFERMNGPLPKTRTIRSGSGRGLHRHFKHPGGYVKTRANTSIKRDVKGDKGFAVLPPSLHKSGGRYEVVDDAKPAPLPDGLLEFIAERAAASMGSRTPEANHKQALRRVELNGISARCVAGIDLAYALPAADLQTALKAHGDDARAPIAQLPHNERTVCLFILEGDAFDRDKDTNEAAAWVSSPSGFGIPEFCDIVEAAARRAGRTGVLLVLEALRRRGRAGDGGFVSWGDFTMCANEGLTVEVEKGSSKNKTELLGRCRDSAGRGWGKQLRFCDADGRAHVSDADLQGEPAKLCAELADEGLRINPSKQKELLRYLSGARHRPSRHPRPAHRLACRVRPRCLRSAGTDHRGSKRRRPVPGNRFRNR